MRALRLLALLSVACTALSIALPARASSTTPAKDDPRSLTVEVVQWNFLGQFGRVWQVLDPRFQKVTTRTFWESCKEKNAPDGVTVRSIKAIDSYADSITLPVVGHIKVEAVTVQLKYTLAGVNGVQTASSTDYWTLYHGTWKGLWTLADYQAYSHHRCPAQ